MVKESTGNKVTEKAKDTVKASIVKDTGSEKKQSGKEATCHEQKTHNKGLEKARCVQLSVILERVDEAMQKKRSEVPNSNNVEKEIAQQEGSESKTDDEEQTDEEIETQNSLQPTNKDQRIVIERVEEAKEKCEERVELHMETYPDLIEDLALSDDDSIDNT